MSISKEGFEAEIIKEESGKRRCWKTRKEMEKIGNKARNRLRPTPWNYVKETWTGMKFMLIKYEYRKFFRVGGRGPGHV